MDNWDEIKTAYQVARLGTVSAAADVLGVHHATVIRHIDGLEQRLKVKLFQRHARGYTPTEAGLDLMRVAQATNDQFAQLNSRLRGIGETVTGEIIVTALSECSADIVPVLATFQADYPNVAVSLMTDDRVFRLAYGEAHVAIRAGAKNQDPDNVVQHLYDKSFQLAAHPLYLDRHGMPSNFDALREHRWVGFGPQSRAPFYQWLYQQFPDLQMSLRCTSSEAVTLGLQSQMGIGIMPQSDIIPAGLVPVLEPLTEWQTSIWAVTHVDLHRSPKVQAVLGYLKRHFQ